MVAQLFSKLWVADWETNVSCSEKTDEITGCWAIIKPQIYDQLNQPWNYMLNDFTSQNHEMHCKIKKNSVYSLCASL